MILLISDRENPILYKLKKYILIDRTPMLTKSVEGWANWFEKAGTKLIVESDLLSNGADIKTFFLGFEDRVNGKKSLFQTIAFDKNLNVITRGYTSWKKAHEGHYNIKYALEIET